MKPSKHLRQDLSTALWLVLLAIGAVIGARVLIEMMHMLERMVFGG